MDSKKLAKIYQKKTDIEHILHAPDTYIGSTEKDDEVNWIFTKDGKIQRKKYAWIPGFYKIFDEGLVNCKDHHTRLLNKPDSRQVSSISVEIDKQSGVISLFNDGDGIDVEKHPEYKLWIPEMIFGHLRTSTNYRKDEEKIVGGKNGFGVKLIMIYSKWAKLETLDHRRGLKYVQEFKNNLSTICKPSVRKSKGKPYTKIEFLPDYHKFGIKNITEDMFNLLKKRTYDIAAVTSRNVKVTFNGTLIPVRTFEQYIDLYIGSKSETKRLYEKEGHRWEYAACLTPIDEFTQVSFVNGIYTSKGGKHIDYILGQITRKLVAYIEKKKKIRVKPVTIKEQLMLFVNCTIVNPSFDSQTKDYMNTPSARFGSTCAVSDKFIDKLAKMGVMENAIQLNELKEQKNSKKTDGKKIRFVRGIPKLIDANNAGTTKSKDCTLILCEGDSAKAGVVSGLSKEDRDFIGVFPLRGKMLNAKEASVTKINNNAEISSIKKILGLAANKEYKTREVIDKALRYGKVLFMTDQDLDGVHIKGLGINLFDSQWPDLIKMENFIGFMNTPIIKAKKGKQEKCFYNDMEYRTWRDKVNTKGWKIKYYKGLGTSTAKEFKEYFKKKKSVYFKYAGDTCLDAIDLVFNKKRADDRKSWLSTYNRDDSLNTNVSSINYSQFVNLEMIHFSKYDCERSIPNMVDGQKTSNRKILFAAFKRKLTREVKVAQFAGYTSEHSCYHHGETSLQKAITGMAQEFVGSNNIAMLMPNGQFGTRLQGGKDSASERYIFTQLNLLTKRLFPEHDMPLMKYLKDDGTAVEPDFYVPIIPMVLVNGSKGIGTGFSTEILCYNPIDIVKNIKNKIEGKTMYKLLPYYEGFKGKITLISKNKYLVKGKYKILAGNKIHVKELPIGMWTDTYKEHLESLIVSKTPIIKNFKDMSTHTTIDILITLVPNVLADLISKQVEYGCNGLEKKLKLYTTKTTTNMHLFDHKQRMKKYSTAEQILEEWFPIRKEMYVKRKIYMIAQLEKIVKVLSNKARFIEEQCNDVIDLRKKKKDAVTQLLESRKFDKVDDEYTYLTSMAIHSLIEENIEKLRKERDEKKQLLLTLKETSVEKMWMGELDAFVLEYLKYRKARVKRNSGK